MKKYIGVKVLRSAKLMTRAEYYIIKDWEILKGENPNDEVYMVEYEPTVDNKPNLEGYEGYVTMSPKDVFEEAYTRLNLNKIETYYSQAHEVRVQEEAEELRTRLFGLDMFIEQNSIFATLPEEDKILMRQQSSAMTAYLSILSNRMLKFGHVSFEDRYIAPMNFGEAIEAAKKGMKIARKGWNGAKMFAVLSPGAVELPAEQFFNKDLKEYAKEKGGTMTVRPAFMLKTAQEDVAYWAPSGSDALAEDWVIID